MSEVNYQEGHETAGQAKTVAWRYRYVKKKALRTFRRSSGLVTGNMYRKKRIVTTGRTMKFRPYSLPRQSRLHQKKLVKAVHFYEQLKRENPPASGNLITDSQIRQ